MGEDGMLKESTVRLTDSSRFDKEERDRYAKMMLGGLVPLFTVSLLFIAVRVYTRKHILKKVKMDDYLLSISWVLSVLVGVAGYLELSHGRPSGTAFDAINPHFLRLPWISGGLHWFYKIPLKLSITLLYISAISSGKFRAMTWLVMVLGGGAALIGAIGSMVYASEDQRDTQFLDERTFKARDTMFAVVGTLDIVTTILLVFIPLPWIKTMRFKFSEKVAFTAVFLGGIFTSIAASFTLISAHASFRDPESTKYFMELVLWGSLKGHFAIASVAALGFRPLLHYHFPKLFLKPTSTSKQSPRTSSQHSIFGYDYGKDIKELEATGISMEEIPEFITSALEPERARSESQASSHNTVSSEKPHRGSPNSLPLSPPGKVGGGGKESLEDIVMYSRGREAMDAPTYGVPRPSMSAEPSPGFLVPQWGER